MSSNSASKLEMFDNLTDLLYGKSSYNIPSGEISIGEFFIKPSSRQTDTECVRAFEPPEPELVPYECSRNSGVLSFWDDKGEDIYSFEDGKPV